MAWIESHQDLGQHPKTIALATALDGRITTAVGVLHLLWHFTLKFAWQNGDLSKFKPDVIAASIGWNDDAEVLIKAFQDSGWLDGMVIHDWMDYAGKIVNDRLYNQKRKRRKTSLNGVKSRKSTATVPYPTVPNQPKDIATLPQPDKPLTDIQKIVLCYKQVTGYPKDDKAWDKLNFARCSKSAKALLEFMGNWKDAADCAQDVYEKLTAKGLTVTLETVIKHAADWKKDLQELDPEGRH